MVVCLSFERLSEGSWSSDDDEPHADTQRFPSTPPIEEYEKRVMVSINPDLLGPPESRPNVKALNAFMQLLTSRERIQDGTPSSAVGGSQNVSFDVESPLAERGASKSEQNGFVTPCKRGERQENERFPDANVGARNDAGDFARPFDPPPPPQKVADSVSYAHSDARHRDTYRTPTKVAGSRDVADDSFHRFILRRTPIPTSPPPAVAGPSGASVFDSGSSGVSSRFDAERYDGYRRFKVRRRDRRYDGLHSVSDAVEAIDAIEALARQAKHASKQPSKRGSDAGGRRDRELPFDMVFKF